MTRRVLIVAPYFPPRRRVGALRPFRFVCHLREAGWQPTVVFLDTPGLSLSDAERHSLTGVELLPLRAFFDTTQRLSSGGLGGEQWNTSTAAGPDASKRASPDERDSDLRGLALRLRTRIDDAIPLDSWAPVLWFHQRRVLSRIRHAPPDVVWSTADPWSSHLLGMQLSRALRVPWVADFRDPWTLCPIRSRVPNWTRQVNERFEAKIIERASAVTFTAEGTLHNYAEHYPAAAQRMHCIRNGFDSSQLQDPIVGPFDEPHRSGLHIVFFGRFRPLSPATALVAALADLKARRPDCATGLRVRCVGTLQGEDRRRAEKSGVLECFEPLTPVPYGRSLAVIREHDLALLSTAEERDDIVPAKLWDYLAAGRPILSLTRSAEVGRLLSQVNGGVQLDPTQPSAVADLLIRCWDDKAAGRALSIQARDPNDALPAFDARHLTAQLARVLETVAAR